MTAIRTGISLLLLACGTASAQQATGAPADCMPRGFMAAMGTNETAGGHTWINWRRYLADFAPRLFRD